MQDPTNSREDNNLGDNYSCPQGTNTERLTWVCLRVSAYHLDGQHDVRNGVIEPPRRNAEIPRKRVAEARIPDFASKSTHVRRSGQDVRDPTDASLSEMCPAGAISSNVDPQLGDGRNPAIPYVPAKDQRNLRVGRSRRTAHARGATAGRPDHRSGQREHRADRRAGARHAGGGTAARRRRVRRSRGPARGGAACAGRWRPDAFRLGGARAAGASRETRLPAGGER